jgi:hypothetical protein
MSGVVAVNGAATGAGSGTVVNPEPETISAADSAAVKRTLAGAAQMSVLLI